MEKTTLDSTEVPTALPGFEDDDAREKLLLQNTSDEFEDATDDETDEVEEPNAKPHKRRWHMVRTFAAFAVFVLFLVVGIAWFFGMGWFSKPQAQAVNRNGQKDGQTSPATEDEKLKMALSMIAPSTKAPESDVISERLAFPVQADQSAIPVDNGDVDDETPPNTGVLPIGGKGPYFLPLTDENSTRKLNPSAASKPIAAENESLPVSKTNDSDEARGRSLFFGISKNATAKDEGGKSGSSRTASPAVMPVSDPAASRSEIPFGTMLPVRLIGSIYTLRNSGGFVRLELTRPVEGKGYSYPAGTLVLGEIRGGESVRAFVNIVGLIDPVSGELVRFGGELLGRDGASGIEGKRRSLTSQWSRFFRGMKDTAASVLGSVGAIRSGGTVILSEPLRRGSESMTEDLSGALLKSEREDTFLEVVAGSNGYVLVTSLPDNSADAPSRRKQEGAKK